MRLERFREMSILLKSGEDRRLAVRADAAVADLGEIRGLEVTEAGVAPEGSLAGAAASWDPAGRTSWSGNQLASP